MCTSLLFHILPEVRCKVEGPRECSVFAPFGRTVIIRTRLDARPPSLPHLLAFLLPPLLADESVASTLASSADTTRTSDQDVSTRARMARRRRSSQLLLLIVIVVVVVIVPSALHFLVL